MLRSLEALIEGNSTRDGAEIFDPSRASVYRGHGSAARSAVQAIYLQTAALIVGGSYGPNILAGADYDLRRVSSTSHRRVRC